MGVYRGFDEEASHEGVGWQRYVNVWYGTERLIPTAVVYSDVKSGGGGEAGGTTEGCLQLAGVRGGVYVGG